jgi:hypothetical protein
MLYKTYDLPFYDAEERAGLVRKYRRIALTIVVRLNTQGASF